VPTPQQSQRLEYISIDELFFDPDNPRFPTTERGAGRDEALRWLLASANVVDVMQSIATQDFFPGEPLLVVKEGGRYKVVEGNRRFAACWLLSHPDDAPTKKRTVRAIAEEAQYRPEELPCLVFPDDDGILPFLGYRHITGIQEWSALAKARYLNRLWLQADGSERTRLRGIARQIGSRSDYVARLLTALGLYDEIERRGFFDIPGLDEETLSFSLLVLIVNRPALAQFIGLQDGQAIHLEGLQKERLAEVTHWFFEVGPEGRTVLGESRNVTRLIEVIENEDALDQLRSGASLSQAHRQLSADEDLNESLAEVVVWLETALGAIERGQAVGPEERESLAAVAGLWADLLVASSRDVE
jgi:hypothetical protein